MQVRRSRDADRSRLEILDAAERLFADQGPRATSLQEIAAATGLSRATPSYFFGSKDALREAVIERLLEDRDLAVSMAFEPVRRWARRDDQRPLGGVLHEAITGYLQFLVERPTFARLLTWESLEGGTGLANVRARVSDPAAMGEALEAVRAAAPRDGVRWFTVRDAVLVLVSLTFSSLAHQDTFGRSIGLDLRESRTRASHVDLVVAQVLAVVRPGQAPCLL